MSDHELIRQTLNGDREAFGILAVKYQERVYNLVFAIVKHREDAEDATQETFLQALTHLSGFRQTSQFYTWLYRIAYNSAVGTLRRRRTFMSIEKISEEAGDAFSADVEAPDAQMIREDDARIVRDAVDKLPDEYRIPLVMREFVGASYEEIAQSLAIPVGTVRSRLHRARASLKGELARIGYAP